MPAKEPVATREAATIMLMREDGDTPLEVLLLKRNSKLKFASSNWVFPGGKIEEYELKATKKNVLGAALIAAVRETREETSLKVTPDQLTFFEHWTTPLKEPIRFSTWFFFAKAVTEKTPVKVDGSEIIEYQWLTPNVALTMLRKGEIMMMPPTFVSLMRISKCKNYEEAKAELSKQLPSFVLPVLKMNDGVMCCMYKGDAGYETGNPAIEGPRHRVEFNRKAGAVDFIYENCELPAISGGNH